MAARQNVLYQRRGHLQDWQVSSCRVVHRSSRRTRVGGVVRPRTRNERRGYRAKKHPSRRRTTRSHIIFYEGFVSVLYIGSLTTRLLPVLASCVSFLRGPSRFYQLRREQAALFEKETHTLLVFLTASASPRPDELLFVVFGQDFSPFALVPVPRRSHPVRLQLLVPAPFSSIWSLYNKRLTHTSRSLRSVGILLPVPLLPEQPLSPYIRLVRSQDSSGYMIFYGNFTAEHNY